MKDDEVLQSINIAYDESKCLLDSALLIKDNEIGGDVRVPTSFMNSSFGMWLYTDGLSLAKHPWFNPLVEQHQLVYEGYFKLFHDAKKGRDISGVFADFDSKVHAFHEKLDEVKEEFCDDVPEPIAKQKVESKKENSFQPSNIVRVKTNESMVDAAQTNKYNSLAGKGISRTEALLERLKNEKKVPSDPVLANEVYVQNSSSEPKNNSSDEYLSIYDEIQQENKNQLALKQELIEQELVQIKDRKILFTKTINQLDYHHLLKEKENKLAINNHKDKLSQNLVLKKKKKNDLKDIETKRKNTQQEFEAMELASIEFEKANLHERTQEKEKVAHLDQEQKRVEKDHKKVINQQAKKKKVLEELRERVQQAEKELESLMADELEVNNAHELISSKKLKTQNEIEAKLAKEHQDREHYLQLEELKFQSLQRVKKQYYSTQQEILHLEHEQKNISQGEKESASIGLKELTKLLEQRDLKQQMLNVLDLEYKQNKLALEVITTTQKKAQIDSDGEVKKLFAFEV